MEKKGFSLIIILAVGALLLLGISFIFVSKNNIPVGISVTGDVAVCSPSYICNDWGKCEDDLQQRVCKDSKCRQDDITERRFCSKECSPSISCNSWGECNYLKKASDILQEKIEFQGYKERLCVDSSGCIENFSEEMECGDSYPVKFLVVQDCGEEFLAAVDPKFNKPISKINIAAWRDYKRLNIDFIQSEPEDLCSYCRNGVEDGDEEDIDCGGSCNNACKEESKPHLGYLLALFWTVSLILIFWFFMSSESIRISRIKSLIFVGESALIAGDVKRAKRIQARIGKIYKMLSEERKIILERDIRDYSFKISHISKLCGK